MAGEITTIADLCKRLDTFPAATASYPFNETTRVYKVGGKMFALVGEDDEPPRVTLKCDPERAEELRALFPDSVAPGYYMNKRHWNTVTLNKDLPGDEAEAMLDHSYRLVVASLTRAVRDALPLL